MIAAARRWLRLSLLAISLSIPGTGIARANPADVFGLGSRAVALGGAATAVVDDSSANYYNPAALARGRDLRIDLGYRYATSALHINDRAADVDTARGVQAGIVAPGAIGPVRFAFGAVLFLPDQRATRVRALAFDQPRFVEFDNRPQRLLLSVNLAFRIVDGVYVGGGITFMSRTEGEVLLRGNVAVIDTEDVSSLQTRAAVDLVAIRYPQVGILVEPAPWLSLALSYRHGFDLSLEQRFRIDGSIGNPGAAPIVEQGFFAARSLSHDLFQPWQLTLGGAVRLHRRVRASYDLTFARWSDFPQSASDLTLELDIGKFNSLVQLPPKRAFPSPGFHDILVPRVGFEWRAWDGARLGLDLRAGYAYQPTPAPEQVGESNLLDSDKHVFTLGAGIVVPTLGGILLRPLTLDAHVGLHYLPERYHRKLDPLDRAGDLAAGGLLVQLGVTLGVKF